jgi:phosphoribosylformimino-5-aminoimidazole carboxamide ribotide isomerase
MSMEPMTMELIPAIDLQDGRCVRLFKGDFDARTVYAQTPQELLDDYTALGAAHIHVVDLDGARAGTQANRDIIVKLAQTQRVSLQVGGGLRSRERVQELLSTGVARAVIGSLAVTAAGQVASWIRELGPDRIVLALDVRVQAGVPLLTTHGWQQSSEVSLWSAVDYFAHAGLRHVLCTDVARDGALSGPNCELYSEAVRRFPQICWQASGGVARGADLLALQQAGVAAVISGKALLEKRIPLQELQPFLPNASSPAST